MRSFIAVLIVSLLLTGCYVPHSTVIIPDGFEAHQVTVAGHGWTEKGLMWTTDCHWSELTVNPRDNREYCPPKNASGSRTGDPIVEASTFDKVVPAVIHGLAFMAGAFGGAAILGAMMPASNISQTQSQNVTGGTVFASTLNGSAIKGLNFFPK